MSFAVGKPFPHVQLKYVPYDAENPDACAAPQILDTEKLFKTKRVVVFGVPAAFSPTCSAQHVPGFIEKADELRKKGVELIICIAGNDFFTLDAWSKSLGAKDKIIFASDANGDFIKASGLGLDMTKMGLGPTHLQRFAAVVDCGCVIHFKLEDDPTVVTVSGADSILATI